MSAPVEAGQSDLGPLYRWPAQAASIKADQSLTPPAIIRSASPEENNMRQLEPFMELLSSGIDWRYKRMRFVGRAPLARRRFQSEPSAGNPQLNLLGAATNDILSRLDSDGYSGTFELPRETVQGIRADATDATFVNRRNRSEERRFDLEKLENGGESGIFSNFSMHEKSPTLRRLIATDIEPVANAYLGNRSRFLNSQVWITFPGTNQVENKDFGWHYDVDDFKFLKFFCYLSDVDQGCGPHAIIPASHRSRHLFRFFNRQIDDRSAISFGEPLVLTGPAGTCFFEDTIIYHKGMIPIHRPRVILQVEFGVAS